MGGDPFYVSEANKFSKAEARYFLGSTALFNSGTAAQLIGSFVFNAGSLGNPAHIVIDTYVQGDKSDVEIEISGLSTNAGIALGGVDIISQFAARTDIIVGSPFAGIIKGQGGGNGIANNNLTSITSINSINNLDTTAPVVIKFRSIVAANGTYVIYNIKANPW